MLPFTLQFLPSLPGDGPVLEIDGLRVVRTLMFAQFLPLCLGLGLHHWRPALAAQLKKPANLLSVVLNLLMLGTVIAAQFEMLVPIPLRAFVGMLVLVLAGVALGWLVGGPGSGNRKALAMATSVRNVGVTLVIAAGAFPGTQAVSAATAFAAFQTLVMVL